MTIPVKSLHSLSYDELGELIAKAETIRAEKRAEAKAETRQRVVALAAKSGFSIHELVGSKNGHAKKRWASVKYSNPANPSETWTGRGRKPNWLNAALSAGKKLESFAASA